MDLELVYYYGSKLTEIDPSLITQIDPQLCWNVCEWTLLFIILIY